MMRWFLLILPALFVAGEAMAVSPAAATQCRRLTLESPDISKADREFLIGQGGGILELCRHPQFENVTANMYFSGVTQPKPGLCSYVIGRLDKEGHGSDERWSLSPSSPASRAYRHQFRQVIDADESCPSLSQREGSLQYWHDVNYVRVSNVDDDTFIAFMRHWRAMTASRDVFVGQLSSKQSQEVAERRDEPLWLLAGCIAATAKGCRIRIEYLEVTSYNRPLVRGRFQIFNFSQIDDLNAGRFTYQSGRMIYEDTLSFWHTPAGFELQR